MFTESQISDALAQKYAAANADGSYSPNNGGTQLDLQAGDKVFAMEGECPLKTGDLPSADGKSTVRKTWPTFTLKIERNGQTKYVDGVAVSNLERGSILVLTAKPGTSRYKISDLQPRLGRRGSVLTAQNGVRYIPETTELGVVVADGNAYLASDFQKGKSDIKAVAPKQAKYGYIK
jgi:hypothetical protein